MSSAGNGSSNQYTSTSSNMRARRLASAQVIDWLASTMMSISGPTASRTARSRSRSSLARTLPTFSFTPGQPGPAAPAGPYGVGVPGSDETVFRLDNDKDGLLLGEGLDRVGTHHLNLDVAEKGLGPNYLHFKLLSPNFQNHPASGQHRHHRKCTQPERWRPAGHGREQGIARAKGSTAHYYAFHYF